MHHTFRVAGINLRSIDGIESLQLRKQRRQPFALQAIVHFAAHRFRNRGEEIDATAKGVDIKHASAARHQGVVRGKMGGAHRQRFFFKTRRAVIVGQSQRADEMMGHARLLCGGGGGGANG